MRALEGYVQGWQEVDRRRALAMMARSGPAPLNDGVLALTGLEPWSPLAWEEAELAAYWCMKTGRALSLSEWIASASETSLEEMRRTALEWLGRAHSVSPLGSSNSG
jgi:hypothetical protein